MPETLNLLCWIIGEDPERPFRVRIDNDKDVGDLQRAIKDRKMENVDEADLKLWKVIFQVIVYELFSDLDRFPCTSKMTTSSRTSRTSAGRKCMRGR